MSVSISTLPWVRAAERLVGVREIPGPASNPTIQDLAASARIAAHWQDDDPWCAVFINGILSYCGIHGTRSALSRSFLTWGMACTPIPGAIGIFTRTSDPRKGHVAIICEHDEVGDRFKILGGNQSDAVGYAWISAKRLIGARWPIGHPTPDHTPKISPDEIFADTAKRLREVGSRTMTGADRAEKAITVGAGVTAALKLLQETLDYVRELVPSAEALRPALSWAWDNKWTVLVLVGVVVVFELRRIRQARVDDAVKGERPAKVGDDVSEVPD